MCVCVSARIATLIFSSLGPLSLVSIYLACNRVTCIVSESLAPPSRLRYMSPSCHSSFLPPPLAVYFLVAYLDLQQIVCPSGVEFARNQKALVQGLRFRAVSLDHSDDIATEIFFRLLGTMKVSERYMRMAEKQRNGQTMSASRRPRTVKCGQTVTIARAKVFCVQKEKHHESATIEFRSRQEQLVPFVEGRLRGLWGERAVETKVSIYTNLLCST